MTRNMSTTGGVFYIISVYGPLVQGCQTLLLVKEEDNRWENLPTVNESGDLLFRALSVVEANLQ